MASKGKYYITTMYRWGAHENHSYVIGVWSKKAKAIDEGVKESEDRGGKYNPEVREFDLNEKAAGKVVYKLEEFPDMERVRKYA